MPVTVKSEKPFKILYNLPNGTDLIVCIGGRGGMKTYEVSKLCAFKATVKKKRCVVLRDEKSLIKDTILNEILTRYDTANIGGRLDAECAKLKTGISDKKTGKELVYTKGFRASANEKKANMKGMSDIDIALVEEAEDLRDADEFDTFIDGLRKEGCLVIIMLNTPDIGHFLVKRYFIAQQITFLDVPELIGKIDETELIGYYKLVPKSIEGFVCIQTGYKDNRHLPKNVIARYEGYGDPNHHLYNLHHYLTAIKGFASTGRKGQVIRKAKPIKLKDYLALPYKEYYGQDFGTASPAGLIGLKKHRNNIYVRQINYKPMHALDIGKLYCTLGFKANDEIIADHADPNSINKLSDGFPLDELSDDDLKHYPGLRRGFNVMPCDKGKDSVTYGIDIIDRSNFYVVEESTDYWNEVYNYIYAQDKNGNYTNDPIDDFNHLIDPTRYVLKHLENSFDDWSMTREN